MHSRPIFVSLITRGRTIVAAVTVLFRLLLHKFLGKNPVIGQPGYRVLLFRTVKYETTNTAMNNRTELYVLKTTIVLSPWDR